MKRKFSLILLFTIIFQCLAFTSVYADSEVIFTGSFHEVVKNKKGFEINNNAAIAEISFNEGRECIMITPTPDKATQGKDANFNFFGGNLVKISGDVLAKTSKVTIDYKYILPDGKDSHVSNMQIVLLSNGKALSSNITANAKDKTKENEWSTAEFDIADEITKKATGEGALVQMWIRPFGPSPNVLAKDLAEYEVMYLDKIVFHGGNDGKTSAAETPAQTPSQPQTPQGGIVIKDNENMAEAKFTVDYPSKVAKIYDNTGELDKQASIDGISCLSITPTPDKATAGKKMNLDVYNLGITAESLDGIKFMGIPYKYVVPGKAPPAATPMQITLLSGQNVPLTSLTKPVANTWTEAIFDISEAAKLYVQSGGTLNQMHFYPYGNALGVNIKKDEMMYIGQFKFYDRYPVENAEFTLSYAVDNPDVQSGEGIPDTKVRPGTEITLPECPWTVENASFTGWKSSKDSKIYAAGTKTEMPESDVTYYAQFRYDTPAVKVLKFQNYQCGTVNNLGYCREVTNTVFDTALCVKVVPNEGFENKNSTITVDGFKYNTANISLAEYKYAAITYFCVDDTPASTKFKLNFMTSGGMLKKQYSKEASEDLRYGEWAVAYFDFSDVDTYLNTENPTAVIKQIHVKPFGEIKTPDFSGKEEMYIHNLTFFKEKPEINLRKPYMKGYDGGLFKPGGNMTRAEAVTVIARLAAGSDALVPTDKTTTFTDVPASAWYHKYIAYVDSLGYLGSYSGAFLPDKDITRAEFVELVYNMGLLKDAGKNGVFTDVPDSHPRAAVISAAGRAGLVNGYAGDDGTFSFKPDNTITRAEIVKVINNAYGRNTDIGDISSDVFYCFSDVEKDHWAYGEICGAVLTHLENGKKWVYTITDPSSFYGGTEMTDTNKGKEYIAELDKMSAERKAEILSHKTENYNIKGTSYYVSADGNDANDGKSPETAWKTTEKVSSVRFVPGDGVFFRRGDTFRGSLTAATGVTYGAYGDGDKPKLYVSPENGADASKWTLLEGTNNIWVYGRKMLDVGLVSFNNDSILAWKIAPRFVGGEYIDKDGSVFDIAKGLSEDLYFFCKNDSTDVAKVEGTLYLRCDKGNPGEVFDNIEFSIRKSGIVIGTNTDITIDNLCIKYAGVHGVAAGSTKNLTVTNCDISYIGGSIQTYSLYGSTGGNATRLGNGVEIYGSADGYTVSDNYIHHCLDAGITHQYNGKKSNHMYNIKYTGNLIEDCAYSIEYFNSNTQPDPGTVYDGRNYLISDNILRRAGNSFGRLPGNAASTHLKGWTSENKYDEGTYIIENNIFDRAYGYILQTPAKYRAWLPVYRGNTYVQVIGKNLGYYDGDMMVYGADAKMLINHTLGDEGAKVYFVDDYYYTNK